MDERTLDALRRQLALRLSRRGEFFCEGDPVTHPRVVAWLRDGLDITESGEPIIRSGDQWAYLTVEDCPLRVLSVQRQVNRGYELSLDDGRTVELHVDTLCEEPGHGLRCSVPARASGRPLPARFTNVAQIQLGEWLHWPDGDPRPRLATERGDVIVPLCEAAASARS